MGDGMMGTFSIWHWLFVILFFAVPIYVIYVLLGRLIDRAKRTPQNPPTDRLPLDILKERFARGEIDKEEFEERRRMLGE